MIQLHDFQADLKHDIKLAWQDGATDVLASLATGGGKTVVFSSIVAEARCPTVLIAHRQEIVSQISLALARNGVRHRIIGPRSLGDGCVHLHLQELGRNHIDPWSIVAVASVDTLIRKDPSHPWFRSVRLVVNDEAHHVLRDNKWGKARAMFPNAKGLGVTAVPWRADGKGLGRSAAGIYDVLVEGPPMGDLIGGGWLSDYTAFVPPRDIDVRGVPIGPSGDFSPPRLSAAVHESRTLLGSTVAKYLLHAAGKRGVTFCVDVEAANESAAAYRAAGVPAEVVTAKTPDKLRSAIFRRFRAGEVLQICNVDILGEGVDVPAIEVVSFARPTASLQVYRQQFGRGLRTMPGKDRAIIIDHAGNVHRHGLPDQPRAWTLDSQTRRPSDTTSTIALRTCSGCTAVYERYLRVCPHCGHEVRPVSRSSPEQVDGDLWELTPERLAAMRGEVDREPTWHPDPKIAACVRKNHRERQAAVTLLRDKMAAWGGLHSQGGDLDTARELQRRFYLTFGIDVLSAQSLNLTETKKLMEKIDADRR